MPIIAATAFRRTTGRSGWEGGGDGKPRVWEEEDVKVTRAIVLNGKVIREPDTTTSPEAASLMGEWGHD